MLYRNISRTIAYCAAALLLSRCAIVVRPTGGPKDTTPPKVMGYLPENKSTHFNTKKIRITFDEYIQLKDLNKQLIVSPPLKYPLETILKGKTLEITIKDTLKDNSTYTFNFGNAILDNNEGNILRNFQYVVSTGDHIDSLSVSGHVQDAFTHDPIKAGYVMLYSDLSDSAVYKTLPAYIALTDDQGNYRIENINSGTYRTIAVSKTQGGDYKYHPYIEGIGFKSRLTEIQLHDTANLNVFMEQEPHLKFIKAKATDRGEVMIVFNRPCDSVSVAPMNMTDSLRPTYTYINYSLTGDTAFYWFNTPFIDSLRFVISNNGKILDTAFVHSFPNNSVARKVKKQKVARLKVLTNARNGFDFHQPITFTFGDPVLKYNANRIALTLGKDTVKFATDSNYMPFSISLKPITQLQSDSTYKIAVLPGAFTDMYGVTNDTMRVKFSIVEPTYFGTLKLDVKTGDQKQYILQMLDRQNNVYRQFIITGSQTEFFDALIPGTYRLRIIADENKNRIWDSGNFLNKIQPEKIYYYPDNIIIRSNWDLTQTWEVK